MSNIYVNVETGKKIMVYEEPWVHVYDHDDPSDVLDFWDTAEGVANWCMENLEDVELEDLETLVEEAKEILEEESNPNNKLRIFVQGGGCSGFQYGFTFDEVQNEDDFEIPAGNFKMLIDAMSMQYLTDATIDYKEDLMGASFVISNPQAVSTCGCGSSFSI